VGTNEEGTVAAGSASDTAPDVPLTCMIACGDDTHLQQGVRLGVGAAADSPACLQW
jgi:hypothetical protein